MKLILSVISAMALLSVLRSESEGSNNCFANAIMCKWGNGATDEDVDDMCGPILTLPTTQNSKCLHDCVLRQNNILTDAGIQVDKYMDTIRDRIYDDEALIAAEKTVDRCSMVRKHPKNQCETTYRFLQCMLEAADDWMLNHDK